MISFNFREKSNLKKTLAKPENKPKIAFKIVKNLIIAEEKRMFKAALKMT